MLLTWLILAAGLEIDESALTGESQPAAKQCAQPVPADTPLGDRSNMAFMNTLLTRGRAELLVTATGSITEAGKAARAADLAPLLIPLVACNDSRIQEGRVIGDPMEAALLVLAAKCGVRRAARRGRTQLCTAGRAAVRVGPTVTVSTMRPP